MAIADAVPSNAELIEELSSAEVALIMLIVEMGFPIPDGVEVVEAGDSIQVVYWYPDREHIVLLID